MSAGWRALIIGAAVASALALALELRPTPTPRSSFEACMDACVEQDMMGIGERADPEQHRMFCFKTCSRSG